MQSLQKPLSQTIPNLFDEIIHEVPDQIALIEGDLCWSYSAWHAEIEHFTKALIARGIKHGDRIGILAGNRAEWLHVHFAAASIGAISVGLNTWATSKELSYQLKHAAIKVLFLEPTFRDADFICLVDKARSLADGLPDLETIVSLDATTNKRAESLAAFLSSADSTPMAEIEQASARVRPQDFACMLYTSGSTALPKGVPLTHAGLINNMWEIGERQALNRNDRLWLAVSLFWSFASVNALFALLTHRACIVLQHHFDAEQALDLIAEQKCSVFYGTPNMVTALEKAQARNPRDLGSLRTGLTLGTPQQIQRTANLGVPGICNIYGLTEAYGNTTVTDTKLPLKKRMETVGRVLPGQTIMIADPETLAARAPHETGEILIRGNVTPAYWDAPEQNTAAFTTSGWFRTGDFGYVDDDGFLYYRGRLKEMIKSGGINVAPAEVEQVLSSHPDIELAFVSGIPDERLDEKVAAVLVLRASATIDLEAVQTHCRSQLASYKLPREIRIVEAHDLPLTTTGKLQRNRLKELF